MRPSLARLFRASCVGASALLLQAVTATAGQVDDFDAAVAEAAARCQVALDVLETGGPDETYAQVEFFREAWQDIIQRFGSHRPPRFADDPTFAAKLDDIDKSAVGALVIIGIGFRDDARSSLHGIEATLAGLRDLGH